MSSNPHPSTEGRTDPWAEIARASAAAPIGLLVADLSGIVLAANREAHAILALDSSDLTGQPVNSLFSSEDANVRKVLVNCIRNGTPYHARILIHSASGATADCDFAVYLVTPGGGSEPYCVVWMVDVSEHAAIQRTLLQAERLSSLGEIVAGVAHELNNPLTGILGFAQLLLTEDLADKTRQRLESIVAEAMRCQAIVQNLRGFSSRSATEKTERDINEVVNSMVTLLEYQMRVDDIDVRRELFPEPLPLRIDPHELGRAILNIVHNAHQALRCVSTGDRLFTVISELHDDEIVLRFRDNGPGIAPENLPRVFDPFFTTREFGEGVGLGLSVTYGIVREHGGRVDVSSTPGNGAEFIVRLPRSHG